MTDQDRAENARIILSHSAIKPEFIQHTGRTIADLMGTVERIDNNMPPCEVSDSSGRYQCNRQSTVFHLELDCPVCLKHFKEIL